MKKDAMFYYQTLILKLSKISSHPKHWKISSINVNRAINSNAQKRTGHKEIIIKNY